MKKIFALTFVLTLASCSAFEEVPTGTTIYGSDNRQDFYEIRDFDVKRNATAVASIWPEHLVEDKGDYYRLRPWTTLGRVKNLHTDEKYYNQPVGSYCSAFLVSPTIAVSAGHCLTEPSKIKKARIVFGYHMTSRHSYNSFIPKNHVYKVKRVIAYELDNQTKNDFIVFELDRPCYAFQPLKLARQDVRKGQNVYIIGYPSGMPLKYAPGARVQSIRHLYFTATVDSFGGNSGSPIFNSRDEVVGILVRGGKDYVRDGDKYRVNVIDRPWYWQGEHATKVSVWRRYVE